MMKIVSGPKVSVIIAAYNAAEYIEECISSIQKQTYDNWELWICDDASTDDTLEIITAKANLDDRIKVLHNDINIFAGASRNKCINKCTGDYVMIQDADDISDKKRIELLVNELQKNSVDFVGSGYYLFSDTLGTYDSIIPNNKEPKKADFLYGIPFCHASLMFKKECLINVDGYRISAETTRGEDYDLLMRLYSSGYKGTNIPDILYGYRVDRDTIKRRKFKYRVDECIIRYKGFKSMGLISPKNMIYVVKPIIAHFYSLVRNSNIK